MKKKVYALVMLGVFVCAFGLAFVFGGQEAKATNQCDCNVWCDWTTPPGLIPGKWVNEVCQFDYQNCHICYPF